MTIAFKVLQGGLLTTIQDLGRPGAMASGVPPGGAMDRFAHRAANLLAGNAPQDATHECTLTGPDLEAQTACAIAVTGADLEPRLDGIEIPMWSAVSVTPGAVLTFGGRRSGARAYVAVSGGFDGDRWLGSRSTSLVATRGGLHGRSLAAGDELATAATSDHPTVAAGGSLAAHLRPDYSQPVLDVIPGPHFRRLDAASRTALFSSEFTVAPESDRTGHRLEGPALAASGGELLPSALVAGAVQLAGSRSPTLLMADHQTADVYPVIAAVASASLPVAAQLAPGDVLRFRQVTLAQANTRRLELAARLASLAAP